MEAGSQVLSPEKSNQMQSEKGQNGQYDSIGQDLSELLAEIAPKDGHDRNEDGGGGSRRSRKRNQESKEREQKETDPESPIRKWLC